MEIVGYVGAIIIGVILGLIGGGGSILTVPIFVYILGINPVLATAYSLFVVGVSALVGAVRNAQNKLVDFRTGFIFACPAFIGVYIARRFLLPAIPDELFSIQGVIVDKDMSIMIFFALIMFVAAFFMIKGRNESELSEVVSYNYPVLILEGLTVGLLTGIVGAGGGFLIIPALVLFAGLKMKKAVATSLMIIAIKSLLGFIGDIQNFDIEWNFLLLFTAFSILGIFMGIYFSQFIEGHKLKKSFGWFVLVMSIYILVKEII